MKAGVSHRRMVRGLSWYSEDLGRGYWRQAVQPFLRESERTLHETYKRVDVLTERDDWVFAGSGCLFAWWDDGAASSAEGRH